MARAHFALAVTTLVLTSALLTGWRLAAAPAGTLHLPDLHTFIPVNEISIVRPTATTREFRYTHMTANIGDGPFEVRPLYDPATDTARGFQRLWTHDSAGNWSLVSEPPVVGTFAFHAAHGHFHFPLVSFGLFHLAPDGSVGTPAAVSAKVGYCIADSLQVADIPHRGVFGTYFTNGGCSDPTSVRGISVGWADRYDQLDDGQSIDVTNLPDGVYWFRVVSDPYNYFVEKNKTNNATDIKLQISGTSVVVLEGPVSPNSQPPSVTVTAPSPGQVSGSMVLVSADASDPSGITSVQFLLDGNPLGAPLFGSPYVIEWDSTKVADGTHYLSAQATANSKFYGTAAPVAVTVSNLAPPPPPPPAPLFISNVFVGNRTPSTAIVGWSTNVPADSMVEYGLAATYGTTMTDPALVTTHAVPLSGLTPATTYHYRITSRDAQGHVATGGDFIFTTPAVSELSCTITAPLPGETVSGTVTVSAESAGTASITGVQFAIDGNNLGPPDVTFPYSASWDTTLGGNGPHAITAVAEDPTHNVATCGPVNVSVSNAPPPPTAGLVMALGFNEGAGGTTADLSGNGNQGSLSGPVWVNGRYGKALSFDGVNDIVTVNDANSLDVAGPMTLEAWVNPRTLAGWRTVLLKERPSHLAYALYGNTDTNRPSSEIAADPNVDVRGSTQVPLNAWMHLAATYDGANLRFYQNAVLVGTRQVSRPIAVSALPLRIGGNQIWGEYFDGLIDEVRVYARALTQSELQTDMNTPIGGTPPPDTAPPVPSGGQPSGTLPSSTTSTALQLTTDEAATCRYSQQAGTSYAAMTNPFAATGTTAHSTTVGGLVSGTAYTYYVRCADVAGNAATADFLISFAIAVADATAPTVSITSPSAGSTVTATITVTANASDNIGVVDVQFLLDGAALGAPDSAAPYSVSWDTRTATNGTHQLSARARDAAGNPATAVDVVVTVSNAAPPPSPNLIAAYAFEEGAGTTTADATGKSHTGTLSGATWTTAGKNGKALSFNGVNSYVSAADANDLDLTNGMTLEAWVRPSALSGWNTVVMKEGSATTLAYSLYAHDNSPWPSNTIRIGNVDRVAAGTSPLPLNTWTHLAATYDGTTMRLFVNGVQVGARAQTGNIVVSTRTLRIGGNSVWGEYFNGLIDDVRIYNRALTAAEIQTDMSTPVK
jgi:hypothetical protein